ncbi:MGAT4D isoform 8, partial [Pan troglodytes]
MRTKQVNLLITLVAVALFSFSCFCIYRITQTISFALGISTVNRGNYSYLKQTLTSVVSRMTLSQEKDSVVIVLVADSNEDYLHSVVKMITKKFKRQVRSGSLEVISIPAFLYS